MKKASKIVTIIFFILSTIERISTFGFVSFYGLGIILDVLSYGQEVIPIYAVLFFTFYVFVFLAAVQALSTVTFVFLLKSYKKTEISLVWSIISLFSIDIIPGVLNIIASAQYKENTCRAIKY